MHCLKTPSVYRGDNPRQRSSPHCGDGKQAMCFAWPVGHSYSKKTAMVLYAQNPIGFAVGLGHTTCFMIKRVDVEG